MSGDEVGASVRGGAAPEELAAVVAVLAALADAGSVAEPMAGYDAWRAARLAALRRVPRA